MFGTFCGVQHSVIMPDFMSEAQLTAYYSYCFYYLLSLPFKGSCMNVFQIERLLVTVSM